MKVLSLLFLYILLSPPLFPLHAQQVESEADRYYRRGLKAYNKNELNLAEEMLVHSLSLKNDEFTAYLLAIVKLKKGDTCGYCKFVFNGPYSTNSKLHALSSKECLKTDSVVYASKTGGLRYIGYVVNKPCLKEIEKRFSVKSLKDSIIRSFYIMDNDSSVNSSYSGFPDEIILMPHIVYLIAETPPEFNGGERALYKYIGENLHYPLEEKEKGGHCLLVVQFVITEEGMITDVKVQNATSQYFEAAAKSLVLSTNYMWKPGKVLNRPVKTKMTLPLSFTFTSIYH